MDIGLAKTFLEIMSSGTFIEAAKKLNLTQTAITTRVQNLESQLSCKLFIRNRSGAKLTREGEVFAKYALTLVQTWESAQAQLQLPVNQSKSIHIGAEISLWNPLMTHWLEAITNAHPDINIHSEVDHTDKLVSQLQAGSLDIIVVHQANYYSGLVVEQVVEEKLIHVQSTQSATPNLFVDWGREFKDNFDAVLPVPRQAALSFSLGPLALKYMLSQGGNGYFRTRVVEPHIQSGKLEKVTNSPEFSYPIYIVYRADNITESLLNVIRCLKTCLLQNTPWLV